MKEFQEFLEFQLINIEGYKIRVYNLVSIFIIIFIAVFILWVIKKALLRNHKKNQIDIGNTYALFQIIKYIIWLITFGFILEAIGIKVTVLLAGSAALLVGVGMGLKQTFNDMISGIILLSERTIKVGDILEIDGDIIMIQDIGLRTSKGLNRDEISILIPNSLITTNKVINWSHQSKKTRFRIGVGVSYGSNVDKVLKILEESVLEHPDVFDKNLAEARFVEFNNSSLDFQVLFFSEEVFRIEKIKSDIRKIINSKFIENGVTIPFPQMDVHIRTAEKS